ncbi:MAG: type II toxin-antitoxin system RelE/ParE family toxin [Armatimonadetes bacterium]|nr:type II toxin-antitoxin system RelE/ParE family toxin [Armatimonadota bacterium]
MKPLRIEVEAQHELAAAVSWYEQQRENLGFDLLDEVEAALDIVRTHPAAGGAAPGVRRGLNVQHYPLKRFPYSIVYLELAHEVRVLAFAHARRRPGYWQER